ncbi:MAG: neutral/alkaline non-lysosomal ceramidase N-terminal domain-containing protein [Bryobacteraceae bacterium]
MKFAFPILCLLAASAAAQSFRAGAARVDITPARDAKLRMSGYGGRTEPFQEIRDSIHVRALVLDDGSARVAIVIADLIGFAEPLWKRIAGRVAEELAVPIEHVMLAGTHTHAAPTLGRGSDDPDASGADAYAAQVESKVIDAVRQARAAMCPARIGAGAGKANVNVNRRARMADGSYWLGRDPDGPSDKTLAVVKFETLSGETIAVFMNYAVHGTVYSAKNYRISGDLPGAAARRLEERLGGNAVAIWTSGAAGDQAPIYNRAENHNDVDVQGRILADEAFRVAGTLRMNDRVRLAGLQKVVTCPGQKAVPAEKGHPSAEYRFEAGPEVNIRLSLLMLGKIALTGVSAEVLTNIAQRLKRESPFTNTIMVTHANGSSGYLPDDAAWDRVSYEIVSARVKRGCAEKAVVNGLLELMDACR